MRPPKIAAHHFLHHMRKRRPHSKGKWLPTLPAKLKCKMTEEPDLAEGWGIHIIEGLNKTLVCMLAFLLTVLTMVIGVSLSIWKGQSVNYVQLFLNALAITPSFLTFVYFWQLDQ